MLKKIIERFWSGNNNQQTDEVYDLCLCCIVKDENDYLAEWINYHLKTGVQHFYIYDNGSIVSIASTIKQLNLLPYVTVISMPGKARQVKAYWHCIQNFGKNAKWIGFIDTDEFIVAKTTRGNIVNFLKDYAQYGGLGINWLIFGSNGNVEKTGRPQLESFTKRSDESFSVNRHIKNIVQPQYVAAVMGAHHFAFKGDKYLVNENFIKVDGSFSDVSVSKIQLNHYYCRSLAEYDAKIKRGYGDTSKKRTLDEFYYHDADSNKVTDTTILELFPKD